MKLLNKLAETVLAVFMVLVMVWVAVIIAPIVLIMSWLGRSNDYEK